MITLRDTHWMTIALEEAQRAVEHGDVPIGCVVVGVGDRELARGHNERELTQDPSAHAEIVAMRRAATALGHWRLENTTLYVTLEPCVMCAGALVNARVDRLVFGAADAKAGAVSSLYRVATDERLNHRLTVVAGALAEQSVRLLQDFFGQLRAQGQK